MTVSLRKKQELIQQACAELLGLPAAKSGIAGEAGSTCMHNLFELECVVRGLYFRSWAVTVIAVVKSMSDVFVTWNFSLPRGERCGQRTLII